MPVTQEQLAELSAAKAELEDLDTKANAIYEQGRQIGLELKDAKTRFREALEAVGDAA